jgi:hypothetical protein
MIANSFFDSPVPFTFRSPGKTNKGFAIDHVLVLKKCIHKVYDCAISLEFTSSDHLLVLMELNLDVGGPPGSKDSEQGFQRQQVKRDLNQVKRDELAQTELERAINGVLEQHGRMESLLSKVVDGTGLDMSVVSADIEALMEEVKDCVDSVLPGRKRSSWWGQHMAIFSVYAPTQARAEDDPELTEDFYRRLTAAIKALPSCYAENF